MIHDDVSEKIESALGQIAAHWRGAEDEGLRNKICHQYQELLLFLIRWEWEGYLEPDSQLPAQYMPKEYFIHEDRFG